MSGKRKELDLSGIDLQPLARALLPLIKKDFERPEIQAEFKAWQEARRQNKDAVQSEA